MRARFHPRRAKALRSSETPTGIWILARLAGLAVAPDFGAALDPAEVAGLAAAVEYHYFLQEDYPLLPSTRTLRLPPHRQAQQARQKGAQEFVEISWAAAARNEARQEVSRMEHGEPALPRAFLVALC